jgi:hypothetical protein
MHDGVRRNTFHCLSLLLHSPFCRRADKRSQLRMSLHLDEQVQRLVHGTSEKFVPTPKVDDIFADALWASADLQTV